MADRRLAPVHAAIAAGRVAVLSVDVFDTLLWRRVPEPADVFLMLGRDLAAAGKLATHISPVAFAELRRAAEKAARERKQGVTGYREIVLTDIYREIPAFVFAKGLDVAMAAEAEFAREQSLMIRDDAVAAVMRQAKAAGARVILVSDTYFTAAQMKTFLAAASLAEGRDFDRLYVSCEAGKPKWRDLFDTILADMAVPPERMLHIGDTLEADIWPCRMRGIAFAHYDKWNFAPRTQTREWPQALAERAKRLGPRGDFGLTGLRSRLYHDVPSDLDAALAPYWSYGAAVLAPAFAGFARWIVATCRAEGIEKLFGLMREGRFLNRLVQETAITLGVTVATEELWLSRRAVLRAALRADTPGLLPEFVVLSPGRTTADMLAEMGLSFEALAAAGLPPFEITDDNAIVRKLCLAIADTPQLLDKVTAVSGRMRANLMLAMSKQFDLMNGGPVTLLDLGYTATIQTALQELLAREGSPLRLQGLYFVLNAKAGENTRKGADLRAYLGDDGFDSAMGKLLTRIPFLLEHACMCAEGTLSHFDADGTPILMASGRDDAQIRQMEALQAGVLEGVQRINAMLGDLDETPADDPFLKAQIAGIVEASHLYPTPQEIATIGGWKHEPKIELTGVCKLSDLFFDGPLLEYRGWPVLQDLNLVQVYWPTAALSNADPFLADVYAAGTRDAYEPVHLSSGPVLGQVVVCPDLGEGFDEKRQGGIKLAMNVFGRAELQATIKGIGPEVYRRLRFNWPRARAVLSLDEVTVVFVTESSRTTRAIPGHTAQWESGTPDGAFVRAEPDAVCVVDLGPPPTAPHGIELTVRLKYLRLEPLFGSKS